MYDVLRYAFVSGGSKSFSHVEIATMIDEMETLQKHLNVTGVFIYDTSGFLVVLEGSPRSVSAVLMACEMDERYAELHPVMIVAAKERLYWGWECSYCNVEYRPPLKKEIDSLREKLASGEATDLRDTKVLSFIDSYESSFTMLAPTIK